MNIRLLGVVAAVLVVIALMFTYTVDEREKALLFKFGEIAEVDIEPGLHFKLPLVNKVRKFDARILTLDAQPKRFLTSEKKNVLVDFFVKWRISDVGQYYRSTRGDERVALSRLAQIMEDGLLNEFSKRTIQEAVSGERSEIMDVMQIKANETAKELGIKVIDVRISRIDLPDEVSGSVYDRMRAERNRVAKDFRARGKEAAERLRAQADRQVTVILAESNRDAEKMRGEGDAKAADIYAQAFTSDEEFYSFHRSLNAYRAAFDGKDNMLVLEPDTEFFKYFGNSQAGKEAPSVPATNSSAYGLAQ